MFNLKKTAIAVLAFGSSAAFAGTMGPVCTPENVTVPCPSSAWDIGIQALYLQPGYNHEFGYAGVDTSATRVNYVETDPDWTWGFKLEGSYHFSTGNDLNLNWYHLGRDTHRVFASGAFAVPLLPGEVDVAFTDTLSIQPEWDAVNLEFGQHSDFGQFKNIRFHGGVQFARIETNLAVSGTATVATDGVPVGATYSLSDSIEYRGFGPRIGADYSYDFGNGLGMYAKGATALLVGTSEFTRNYADSLTPNLLAPVTHGSRTAVVPELEAKLGLNYTYAMAQGDLSLDVGYMWANYFNAQEIGVGGVVFTSDFNVHGPYVGLKWVGSVV